MVKIAFMGAGSTVFAKNILGDCLCRESLRDARFALYDIDGARLRESERMIRVLNDNLAGGRAKISAHLGVRARRAALRGADFVVNAIQVGGYEPSTVIDFEVPRKYGLRQTIADTLGIGGIFRALRTIPVLLDFASDMEEVCPNAWLLNYSNPMAMLTGAVLQGSAIRAVGLCHSVQVVGQSLLSAAGLTPEEAEARAAGLTCRVAGINHMAWLLEVRENGRDVYPDLRRRAIRRLEAALSDPAKRFPDMVRVEIMRRFGCYVTESSEHNAEYTPYFIKAAHPELIDRYQIPLDEYPRRCVRQIEAWKKRSRELCDNPHLTHEPTREYGSAIIDAVVSDRPLRIGGNVLNHGLIPNLPPDAVVEVPCLVDGNGVQGTAVGDLPEACAALNRTNINPQLLAVKAALTGEKAYVYQAALLDPHTSAELTVDETVALCDDLIAAHGAMLPRYR